MLANRTEERLVGVGIVKRLARSADDTDSTTRQKDRDGRSVAVDLLRQDAAKFRAFGSRRTHERGLRVVLVEKPTGKFRWHTGGFAKIHHVKTARYHDGRNPGLSGSIQAF